MKNRTFVFFAVIVAMFVFFKINGQPSQDLVNRMMPKPVPTSPNVASLGKFGDYQVSHFSGVPEISIPIYEVQSGNLKVPVTLSYHAGGIKPTDVASWVGMGWSLSAGGQISRTVNGKIDEEYYSGNALHPNPSVCGPPGTGTFYYLLDAATGVTDTEPDVFSYSFGGRRGKFLLPYNSPPYLVPYAPLDIIGSSGLNKFEVTDEQGVLYRFGQNAQGTSFSEGTTATNGGNPAFSATTAWHLAEIISPNSNDQITFSYQALGTFNTHDISYSYAVTDQCYTAYGGVCPANTFTSQLHNNDSYGNQMGLQTIIFETGKVQFFSNSLRADVISNLKRLDSIQVQNPDGTVLKTIKFIYSYFSSPLNANAALKLDALQFKDKTGKIIQQYKFEYFTNSFSWSPNNDPDLNARDLWGYYNGATGNTDLLLPKTIVYNEYMSSPAVNLSFGGAADRNVNIQYIKEGVLKKIIYPTGGYTEFDFESHKYLNNGTATLVGGLRVSKITSSDGTSSPPIVKTYKYGDASSSSESGFGLPNFAELQFNYSNTQQYYSGAGCGTFVDVPYAQYQIRSFHSNSAFSTDPFDSSPVKYPYATEYSGDPSGVTNGKITYEFDNGSPAGDVNHVVPNSGKYFRNSFFWKRGKLTNRTVYDNVNNKLSSTSISYSTFQEISKYVGIGAHHYYPTNHTCTGNVCFNEVDEQVPSDGLFFTIFNLNSGVMMENSVTETSFESGNVNKYVSRETVTTHEATYLQPIISTVIKDNETQYKTVNRYPFQLTANSSSTGNAKGIYMLNSKHIVSTPVETYTYVAKGATEKMTSAQVTTYRQHEGNLDYVVPDQIYLWEPSTSEISRSTYAEMAINGLNNGVTMDEDHKPRIKMIRYNREGDIIAASKTDDLLFAYQYGYKKALPIAEVRNARNDQYTTTETVESTATSGITFGGAPGVSTTRTIEVDYTGTVLLKMSVSGTPSYTTVLDYSGITTGSVTLATGGCGLTTVEFSNVAPGTYTLTLTLTTPDPDILSLGACGHVTYPALVTTTTTTGIVECYYEGFEESSDAGVVENAVVAHCGKRYKTNGFSIPFTKPNSKTYVLEYWSSDVNNVWQFISTEYTSATLSGTIDDIRIYPKDAFMTNYVYEPVVGITSVIDENGKTLYYDYDNFGRLVRIRNDKGGIEKQYTYNYKN